MENAVKKAREFADLSSCCTLADDSGICVGALDGCTGSIPCDSVASMEVTRPTMI